ncbi:DUF4348 domain-containing protein [Saccharicrinis sp. FJH62]|uniref:DUF4348 domain-containing protein n=1 Tax=Saccharicrinis sp. FJH62 TaxID=3344657 RepID=UPI0035D52813
MTKIKQIIIHNYKYYIFLFCLFTFGIIKSQESIDTINAEVFEKFLEKFYSDTLFQQSRISKPLKGVILDWDDNDDSVIESSWDNKKLEFITSYQSINREMTNTKQSFSSKSNQVTELIFSDNSGFYLEREFIRKKGKWYLERYKISNL